MSDRMDRAASNTRAARGAAMRALQLLEYALASPAPRRQRTWLHRVTVCVDALAAALAEQMATGDEHVELLSQIATERPELSAVVGHLQQNLLGLRVSVASLREQVEPDPEMHVDPAIIRDRLAMISMRYRQHLADESDLVYDATGIDLHIDTEVDAGGRPDDRAARGPQREQDHPAEPDGPVVA